MLDKRFTGTRSQERVPVRKELIEEPIFLPITALDNLDAPAAVMDFKTSPYVNSYLLRPGIVKTRWGKRALRLSRFRELANDLALVSGVPHIQVQPPRGRSWIEIQIPNDPHPGAFH